MKRRSKLFIAMPSLALALNLPASGFSAALEEVIVTAQKTEESVQDVPISMTAYSASGLQDAGIRSSDELSAVTPGLQFGRAVGSATPFIRGVGSTNSSIGDESSVASYVDGVYYASMIAGVQSFNNLERVEVLKGPQGTLFGRNATGGLIHYITLDPQQETALKVKLGYGNYGAQTASIYANSGITENLAADIALYHEDQAEGYGRNRTTGKDINEAKVSSARSKWLLTPTDVTSATLALDYSESKSSIGAAFAPAPDAFALISGSTYTGDWWDALSDYEPYVSSFAWGASLKIEHEFETIDFTSITAYRDNNERQHVDQDGTALNVVDADLHQYTKTFSQELRLTSDGDWAQWIAGLYFFDAEAGYDPLNISGIAIGLQTGNNFLSRQVIVEQDTRSIAAFGQSTFALSDELRLTLGLRYTYDKREIDADDFLYTGLSVTGVQIPLASTKNDETWGELTWRTALDYQIADDMLLYGSYSRGFKSGLFNSIRPQDEAVDPEILDAFEIGLKSDFMDGTLRWNTAIFYYIYTDMQMQRLEGGTAQLLNAGESTNYGLDTSLDFAVTDSLTLVSSLSLLRAEFEEFDDAPISTQNGAPFFGNSVVAGDASGNDVMRSPRFTANIGMVYSVENDLGGFDASVFYYHNDGFSWEPDNRFEQEAYSTVNANLAWRLPGDQWEFGIYGRNLADEEYSYYATGGDLGDLYTAAPPRTYGVTVQYSLR